MHKSGGKAGESSEHEQNLKPTSKGSDRQRQKYFGRDSTPELRKIQKGRKKIYAKKGSSVLLEGGGSQITVSTVEAERADGEKKSQRKSLENRGTRL